MGCTDDGCTMTNFTRTPGFFFLSFFVRLLIYPGASLTKLNIKAQRRRWVVGLAKTRLV